MEILIAEDYEASRVVLKKILELAGHSVVTAKNGLDALNKVRDSSPDLIISDILMPVMDGFRFCREVKQDAKLRKIPFMFYTATYTDLKDEELAIALGASRFIKKPAESAELLNIIKDVLNEYKENRGRDSGEVFHEEFEFVERHEERVEAKLDHKVKALVESEERFRTIFESSPVGISIANSEGVVIDSNPAFQNMLGYTREELVIKFKEITHPDDVEKSLHLFTEMVKGKRDHYWMEKRYIHKDGSIIWANLIVTAIKDQDGEFKYNFAIVENITERKKLEDQLRHAQKMEAIGQLAAGVAHDFNNILTAIIGYGNLLKMKLKDNEQLFHNINQILAITERGAGLTQSLLAFSRKQIISLKPVNLNGLVERIGKLIPRFIGEHIEFRKNLSSDDITIMADSGQLEQVLMNLAGNARDAMPEGGVLTIDTALVELNTDHVEMYGFGSPGPYALITVSDTGTGIDAEILDKIFEPFFTTKAVGEGTGLGLSLVYGIIKQHDGYINAFSESGHGATFKIHIPIAKETAEEGVGTDEQLAIGGTETILLAEDEKEVRGAMKSILEEYGFTVIEAADGKEAIEKYLVNKNSIQLLIFDVVMPNISGKEAFEEIRKTTPGIKAIFSSGYTIKSNGVVEDGTAFISKPVHPRDLLRIIREVMDET